MYSDREVFAHALTISRLTEALPAIHFALSLSMFLTYL